MNSPTVPTDRPLGVAMIGYAFMGRAHSQAWRTVGAAFDVPPIARRVIVGRDEVFEQLAVYQQGDDSGWARRLNSSWTKMLNSFSVLQQLEDDRAEVSPVLKVMIGPEEARAFTELYREIAAGQNDDDADVTTQEDDR